MIRETTSVALRRQPAAVEIVEEALRPSDAGHRQDRGSPTANRRWFAGAQPSRRADRARCTWKTVARPAPSVIVTAASPARRRSSASAQAAAVSGSRRRPAGSTRSARSLRSTSSRFDVTRQRQVLKPIVQHMDRHAERALGDAAGIDIGRRRRAPGRPAARARASAARRRRDRAARERWCRRTRPSRRRSARSGA